jgi:hypothetical protein
MMGPGEILALQIILGLVDRAAAYSAALAKAKAEGRDISDAEILALAQDDDVARAEQVRAIARRRAQEAKIT